MRTSRAPPPACVRRPGAREVQCNTRCLPTGHGRAIGGAPEDGESREGAGRGASPASDKPGNVLESRPEARLAVGQRLGSLPRSRLLR